MKGLWILLVVVGLMLFHQTLAAQPLGEIQEHQTTADKLQDRIDQALASKLGTTDSKDTTGGSSAPAEKIVAPASSEMADTNKTGEVDSGNATGATKTAFETSPAFLATASAGESSDNGTGNADEPSESIPCLNISCIRAEYINGSCLNISCFNSSCVDAICKSGCCQDSCVNLSCLDLSQNGTCLNISCLDPGCLNMSCFNRSSQEAVENILPEGQVNNASSTDQQENASPYPVYYAGSAQSVTSDTAGRARGFWGMSSSQSGFGKDIQSKTFLQGVFEVSKAVAFHEPAF